MEINKSLNVTLDTIDNDIEYNVVLTFKFTNFEVILDSGELYKVDWTGFITKEIYSVQNELTDSYGSHCDNGFIKFTKNNNILEIHGDSATGFVFRFNIPFEKVKNEFESLIEWYKKNLN